MNRASLRYLRYAVQAAFLMLTLIAGYQFYHFVLHFESPANPFVQRPPSVDAFLPIAGLISFKHFLFTGSIDPVHPAAFVMFVAIIAVSLLLKKGFCGWICPVGTVSQYFWMAGEKVFRRNFRIWKYADTAIRSIKYILMAFFLVFIGAMMSREATAAFLSSDYFKVADVKTMQFFTEMSDFTFWFLIATGGLSLVYKNFWCRYLCPYGALLGLLSRLSPVKVRRIENNCSHCHACSRHCPALIDVEKKDVVTSAECFGCLTCVSRCRAKGALDVTVGSFSKRKVFSPYLYPLLLIVVFYLIIGGGMLAGKWNSALNYREYQRLIPAAGEMSHPTSFGGPASFGPRAD
ncbi:MAG: 4Fe-4S binding protein [Nitrospiraceae bacterium]|nr:4Fe-4S binding protein [Nitrospiraceae bacterium]